MEATVYIDGREYTGSTKPTGRDALNALVNAFDILRQLKREDVFSLPVVEWTTIGTLANAINEHAQALTKAPNYFECRAMLNTHLENK